MPNAASSSRPLLSALRQRICAFRDALVYALIVLLALVAHACALELDEQAAPRATAARTV